MFSFINLRSQAESVCFLLLLCKDRRRVELKNKHGAVSMEVSQLVCVCVYVGQCNAAVRQAGRVAGQPASQSSPIARTQSVSQPEHGITVYICTYKLQKRNTLVELIEMIIFQ